MTPWIIFCNQEFKHAVKQRLTQTSDVSDVTGVWQIFLNILKWQIDCVWKWANLRTIEHRDFQGEMATTNGSANLLFDQIIPKVHANEEHWAEGIYVDWPLTVIMQ